MRTPRAPFSFRDGSALRWFRECGPSAHLFPSLFMSKKNKDVAGAERPAEQPAEAGASPEAKRRPIQTFRVEDVSASVWSREFVVQGQPRTFYSVTFERSYKDAQGTYRYTKSFDLESLGKVVTVAQQAAEFIHGLAYPAPERSSGTK